MRAAAYHDRADALAAAEGEQQEEPADGLPIRSIRRIELRGAVVRYAGRRNAALSGVDLEIPYGRRLAVVGPSGSGKSTLLGVVSGGVPVMGGAGLVLFEVARLSWKGSRVGTAVPNVIVASYCYRDGAWSFWGQEARGRERHSRFSSDGPLGLSRPQRTRLVERLRPQVLELRGRANRRVAYVSMST